MKFFSSFPSLKSLTVAVITVVFSVLLFFFISWIFTSIHTAVSSPVSKSNGAVPKSMFSSFGSLNGLGSLIGFGGEESQAGLQSAKYVESNFFSRGRPRKLIIDTDGGVDDAIAVFMVLSESLRPVQVLAITTVGGHTDVESATKNILRTLKVLEKDKDVPIYMGTTVGILKYPENKDEREYYFGYEGYGDTGIQGPSLDELPKYHAVLAIIDSVKKYPGEITIFCMGPLTNIALAIRIYPQFVRDVKQIYILGGSVYRLDAMDSSHEFNFQQDPEALKIVFDDRINFKSKIYFINWENVSSMNIQLDWRVNVLGKIKSPKMRLINHMEQKPLNTMKKLKHKFWICPSAILAAFYLHPSAPPIQHERKITTSNTSKLHTVTPAPFRLNRMQFMSQLMRSLS